MFSGASLEEMTNEVVVFALAIENVAQSTRVKQSPSNSLTMNQKKDVNNHKYDR